MDGSKAIHGNGSSSPAKQGLPSPPSRNLRAAALVLLILGAYLLHASLLEQPNEDYCIVIDAGSSGTRLHVMSWNSPRAASDEQASEQPHLPPVEEWSGLAALPTRKQRARAQSASRKETEPGLDKFFNKTEQLRRDSLGPLLSWALTRIPVFKHSSTPIFLFATAGLRRMKPEESHWVLEAARDALAASPFYFEPRFARIISGSDEATFGWVALNFIRGTLSFPKAAPTFGALDLGGSSMEITFEVPENKSSSIPTSPVALGSMHLLVYARSFEGYGMNDAFDWTVGMLLSKKKEAHQRRLLEAGGAEPGESRTEIESKTKTSSSADGQRELEEEPPKVEHPCLHKGNTVWHTHRGLAVSEVQDPVPAEKIILVGNPNVEECAKLAHAAVFRAAEGDQCSPPECILGAHDQPAFEGTFFALAGFHIVAHFFFESFLGEAATSSSSRSSSQRDLQAILERGAEFCMRPWEEVHAKHGHIKGADMNCFRAPYTAALLREGLGLKEEQLVLAEGGGLSWTLGAALLEGLPVVKELRAQSEAQHLAGEKEGSSAGSVSADGLVLGSFFSRGSLGDFPSGSQVSFALFLAVGVSALMLLLVALSLVVPHVCPWLPRPIPSRWLVWLPRGISDTITGSPSRATGRGKQQYAGLQAWLRPPIGVNGIGVSSPPGKVRSPAPTPTREDATNFSERSNVWTAGPQPRRLSPERIRL